VALLPARYRQRCTSCASARVWLDGYLTRRRAAHPDRPSFASALQATLAAIEQQLARGGDVTITLKGAPPGFDAWKPPRGCHNGFPTWLP
jgi:hypothetical protein